MNKPKIRGYLYEIVEIYPVPDGNGFREVTVHDRLEDATKVLEVLESVNYNFTCYGLMMRPVWEDEHLRRQVKQSECDHNGSTTTVNTSGDWMFDCPKCGKHEECHGWDDIDEAPPQDDRCDCEGYHTGACRTRNDDSTNGNPF